MAKLLNVAPISYQNYENGRRSFPEDLLRKTCEILVLDFGVVSGFSVQPTTYDLAIARRFEHLSKHQQEVIEKLLDAFEEDNHVEE